MQRDGEEGTHLQHLALVGRHCEVQQHGDLHEMVAPEGDVLQLQVEQRRARKVGDGACTAPKHEEESLAPQAHTAPRGCYVSPRLLELTAVLNIEVQMM